MPAFAGRTNVPEVGFCYITFSVFRRPLHVINNKNFDRPLRRLQFQTDVLNGCEDRWARWIWRRCTGSCRASTGGGCLKAELQLDIVQPFETCFVNDRPACVTTYQVHKG